MGTTYKASYYNSTYVYDVQSFVFIIISVIFPGLVAQN